LTNWKQVACSSYSSAAIKTDGTLWTWGENNVGQLGLGNTTNRSSPVQVGNLSNWKELANQINAAGMAAIKTDGTLWAWGANGNGRLGLGDTTNRSSPVQVGALTNWKEVTAGGASTLAIKTDGTLWSWGFNTNGELGLGNTTHRSSPVQVSALTNWKEIATGQNHAIATFSIY
jgi:alpha-tubulin suppressor-like RCC1 family protein